MQINRQIKRDSFINKKKMAQKINISGKEISCTKRKKKKRTSGKHSRLENTRKEIPHEYDQQFL